MKRKEENLKRQKIGQKNILNHRGGVEAVERYKIKRRDKLKKLTHNFSGKEWINKKKKTKGFCKGYKRKKHYVGIKKLTMDHTPSIYSAPENYVYKLKNVTPLCQSCNSSKNKY